jgi:hypothetical protein
MLKGDEGWAMADGGWWTKGGREVKDGLEDERIRVERLLG